MYVCIIGKVKAQEKKETKFFEKDVRKRKRNGKKRSFRVRKNQPPKEKESLCDIWS